MQPDPSQTTIPTAQEVEVRRFGVECPNCTEWHEHDDTQVGRKIECICDCVFMVVR